jgi:hypothetical protein
MAPVRDWIRMKMKIWKKRTPIRKKEKAHIIQAYDAVTMPLYVVTCALLHALLLTYPHIISSYADCRLTPYQTPLL